MKKFGFILLIILIFVAGCVKKDSPASESPKVTPSTVATLAPESVDTTTTGKIIQLSMTSIDTGFALTEENHIIWMLEGKCDTIISNDKFFDDNIGIGLDKNGCLCTTKDGGFIWNKEKGFSYPGSNTEPQQHRQF